MIIARVTLIKDYFCSVKNCICGDSEPVRICMRMRCCKVHEGIVNILMSI